MAHEIVWTRGAEADLLAIYQEWDRALSGDEEWIDSLLLRSLQRTLDLVALHPEAGPRVARTKKLRRILLGPKRRYGIFYVIEGRRILIHAVIDLRQDPKRLWERLRDS